MDLLPFVLPTFGPALLIALLTPRRWLVTALAVLSLIGIGAVVFFLNVKVFTCGGGICLDDFIVAMSAGAAAILGDGILLGRWIWTRRRTQAPETPPT